MEQNAGESKSEEQVQQVASAQAPLPVEQQPSQASSNAPESGDVANGSEQQQPLNALDGVPAPALPAAGETLQPGPANGNGTQQSEAISRDEVALYDRQIRLWGMQAQSRISKSRVLLVNLKGLGNEVAKNLVLAGIGSLTISDVGTVTEDDLGSQFFLRDEDVGQPRAAAALPRIQKLNQRVRVEILPFDPFSAMDASFLAPYTIVIGTDLSWAPLNALSAMCRISQKPMYAAGSHGINGFIFADLLTHNFSITRDVSNRKTEIGYQETATRTIVDSVITESAGKKQEVVTKREQYQPISLVNLAPLPPQIMRSPRRLRQVPALLPFLRALWAFEQQSGGLAPDVSDKSQIALFTHLATEKSRELQLPFDLIKSEGLRSFLQNMYIEIPPTSAFLGAALAQDVINVLSLREQPIQNLMIFDGEECRAEIFALHPLVTTEDIGGLGGRA